MTRVKRGLFYCQYGVGIGHLMRSLNLCRSLIKEFEIDFLLGGYDLNLSLDSPRFHLLPLPPLSESDLEGNEKHTKMAQRLKLIEALHTPYDFLITGMFPFSKLDYKREVESLICKLKTLNSHCLVACSQRDSISQLPLASELETLNIIKQYYDLIFVHSDPRIFRLEESFNLTYELTDKLIYTGFIVNPDADISPKPRQNRIVVSLGSGSFGNELFHAVSKVIPAFFDYQFLFSMGPKAPLLLSKELTRQIQDDGLKNCEIVNFIDNFPECLSKSALSISLGGYSIIDAVSTKTPAIIYPVNFFDQFARAIKFARLGFLSIITDLAPETLIPLMRRTLSMTPPSIQIDMAGTEKTTQQLKQKLGGSEPIPLM
jgi:predicted glycosyltransferase